MAGEEFVVCGTCEHYNERMVIPKTRPPYKCSKCKTIVKATSRSRCPHYKPSAPGEPEVITKPLF
jgi:hypothetical protein